MIDEYDKLIGLIYDGIVDDTAWNVALAHLAVLIGAIGAALAMQDMRTLQFRDLAAFGIDQDLSRTYRRLARDSAIWQEIGSTRRPLTHQMVAPKAALVRTELFADGLTPQKFRRFTAFPARFKQSACAVVAAFRNGSLADFEAGDLVKLRRSARHFGRALSIRLDRERTDEQFAATNLMLDDVGDAFLLIDREVRLRHANAAARTMLDRGKALRAHNGRLELHDPEACAELAQMAEGARGGELRLSGARPEGLIVQLRPCANGPGDGHAGCMTVRVVDPNRERERPTPSRLRDRLGVTRRQSEVIAALAAGGTETEAARNLSLSEPTLHTHIRRIYDRLDLRSRAELLALLARHGFDTSRACK